MLSLTVVNILPTTRELNVIFRAHLNKENNYLEDSYVYVLNGWHEDKSGIEKPRSLDLYPQLLYISTLWAKLYVLLAEQSTSIVLW